MVYKLSHILKKTSILIFQYFWKWNSVVASAIKFYETAISNRVNDPSVKNRIHSFSGLLQVFIFST